MATNEISEVGRFQFDLHVMKAVRVLLNWPGAVVCRLCMAKTFSSCLVAYYQDTNMIMHHCSICHQQSASDSSCTWTRRFRFEDASSTSSSA